MSTKSPKDVAPLPPLSDVLTKSKDVVDIDVNPDTGASEDVANAAAAAAAVVSIAEPGGWIFFFLSFIYFFIFIFFFRNIACWFHHGRQLLSFESCDCGQLLACGLLKSAMINESRDF